MLLKIRAHADGLLARKRSLTRWRIPESTKKELLAFLQDLELGKVNRGRKISAAAQLKYLNVLKVSLEWFGKPTVRLTAKDVERFESALSADRVTSRSREHPYAHATKVGIRKGLKVFLRWRLGQAKALKLAGWLDTRDKEKTPEFLTEQEVEQLYRKCRTSEQRYLVVLLFDSGARAEEFINIRREDIQLPEGKSNFVKLTLREEFSKTKGRTVSLYWRHSLEAVTEYLNERVAHGLQPQDPIFDTKYDAMRIFLARLGHKVLQRRIHPHLFRHSSATYYATKLNRQELCYRYGWRFSSNMPDIYISRAGMENRELDMKFTKTEIGDLKDDFTKIQQETKIKDDRIAKLESSLTELQQNFQLVAEILHHNPSLADVEAALRRKKQIPRATP
jgi:integrase